MANIHSTFLATPILEMNSVNFGNKKGIKRELVSKINAVGSNLSFKSFPKLESYLYIANVSCQFYSCFSALLYCIERIERKKNAGGALILRILWDVQVIPKIWESERKEIEEGR